MLAKRCLRSDIATFVSNTGDRLPWPVLQCCLSVYASPVCLCVCFRRCLYWCTVCDCETAVGCFVSTCAVIADIFWHGQTFPVSSIQPEVFIYFYCDGDDAVKPEMFARARTHVIIRHDIMRSCESRMTKVLLFEWRQNVHWARPFLKVTHHLYIDVSLNLYSTENRHFVLKRVLQF